jgi:hypothetical protein
VRQALDKVVVSHQLNRKVYGPLHDATSYGWHMAEKAFVIRKKVCDLKETEIDRIIDNRGEFSLQGRIRAWVAESGLKRLSTEPFFFVNRHGEKVEVRRVRIKAYKQEQRTYFEVRVHKGGRIEYSPFNSNHHVVVYENKVTGERTAEVVTMAEAAWRGSQGETVYQPQPHVGWRVVMVLHTGDVVRWEDDELFLVKTFFLQNPIVIRLQKVTYAKPTLVPAYDKQIVSFDGLKRLTERVRVDRLGRVWPDP